MGRKAFSLLGEIPQRGNAYARINRIGLTSSDGDAEQCPAVEASGEVGQYRGAGAAAAGKGGVGEGTR